ncbi:MAG: allophanate hydrolase [Acidimicrobiales bacterium]
MAEHPSVPDRGNAAMTAAAAVDRFLETLASHDDPAVFVSVGERAALQEIAAGIDGRPESDVPLRGMVFAVKDNIDVAGFDTTAGCPAFAYRPAMSAAVVERLVAAGAVPVAKTNLDQFATGLVGTRSPHGTPRNPHDPDHVPGGSSSGSAVAVALGLVDFALGTDTAGSGRVPAAFCGIVGLKPTVGSVSCTGVVPAVKSIDCVSFFARDVATAVAAHTAAAAFDPTDPFARRPSSAPRVGTVERIGIVADEALRAAGADDETIDAYGGLCDAAAAHGLVLVPVDLDPFLEIGRLLYGGPWVAERTHAVGNFIDEHPDDADPTVAAIIAGGRAYSAVDAYAAEYRLRTLRREVEAAFAGFDALALPTVPHGATLAEVAADPIGTNSALGVFTSFVNLADLSGMSFPWGSRTGSAVPLGMTLYGPAWADDAIASAAADLIGEAMAVAAPTSVPAGGSASTEPEPGEQVRLVVAGAHLRGQPLEHQLLDLGAEFVETTATAANYRLYALDGHSPPKPGLVYDPTGATIEVDVWTIAPDGLGRFLGLVPAPLALGKVELGDGSWATGFVCEPRAIDGAHDITHLGGWRAHVGAAAAAGG